MHIGDWLREARHEAGLSVEEVTFQLRGKLPPVLWKTSKTVYRAEAMAEPNPVLVAALAEIYGKADKVPEPARDQITRLSDLLIGIKRWTDRAA